MSSLELPRPSLPMSEVGVVFLVMRSGCPRNDRLMVRRYSRILTRFASLFQLHGQSALPHVCLETSPHHYCRVQNHGSAGVEVPSTPAPWERNQTSPPVRLRRNNTSRLISWPRRARLCSDATLQLPGEAAGCLTRRLPRIEWFAASLERFGVVRAMRKPICMLVVEPGQGS